MAATALLRFVQGTRSGAPGEALVVVAGTSVNISNGGDNTDVKSWRIELLEGPVGSSFEQTPGAPTVLAQNAADPSPGVVLTPDNTFSGSYRIRLTVWDAENYAGVQDVDIRVFTVPTPNKSIILPPYQKLPDPLPLPGSGKPGAKPDEMNFEGQPYGWSGPNYAHPTYGQTYQQFRLLNAALELLDSGAGPVSGGGGALTTIDKQLVPLATAGDQQDTGIVLTDQPAPNGTGTDKGYVAVFVNGMECTVGDGSNVSSMTYFGPDAATARALDEVLIGDTLFWNDSVAGFSLAPTDIVTLIYEVDGTAGGGGGYATIQDEGAALPPRTILNFIGPGVSAVDDAGNNRTNVTITGGGGGSSSLGTGVFNVANGTGGWAITRVAGLSTPGTLERVMVQLPAGDPSTAQVVAGTLGNNSVYLQSSISSSVVTSGLFFEGAGLISSVSTLTIGANGDSWVWPLADGTPGQSVVTDGAGNLSFGNSGIPLPTIQSIAGADPTPVPVIQNTMNTHVRVNWANPVSLVLPPGTVGKHITVKDVSGLASTNAITVSGGTVDGGANYIIATDKGSATFVCVGVSPDTWDVV